MTDAVVVGAIHEAFTPLLVINNKAGEHAKWLKKYSEPAWNYQVVRFFGDQNGKELIPRKDKIWSKKSLLPRMVAALEKADKKVPRYLKLAVSEEKKLRKLAVAQHCFWVGEVKLGKIDGVVTTEAGWFAGMEVTVLEYDSEKISAGALVKAAQKLKCATHFFISDESEIEVLKKVTKLPVAKFGKGYRVAKESDQKKQIEKISGKNKLTRGQLSKLNAWFHKDREKALSFIPPMLRENVGK